MERRPPSARGQDRGSHNSAQFKDAKEAYTQNDVNRGEGSHHEAHEPQSDEAFLEHMNARLKESAHERDKKK